MDSADVSLRLGLTGPELVEVDGADITDAVAAVTLTSRRGDLPRIGLGLQPGVDVQAFEGTAVVVAQPAGEDVARWLANIDPKVVDKEVMENLGWGDSEVIPAVMALLIRWAKGET